MNRRSCLALAASAGALSVGVVAANLVPAGPRAVAQAPPAASPAPDLPPSPKGAEVVDAANAFLATLSEKQREVAQVELKASLAIRWTNFPGGSESRNGVFYRELKPEQVEAALKVARVALGEEGFARYQEVRAADDAFAKGAGRRGPGGGGGPGGPGGPAGMFEQSDANKDGKLSRDEAPGFLRDRFDEADANKDGFITLEEDTKFMAQNGPGAAQKKAGGAAQKKGGPGGGGMQFGSANYMIAFLGKPSTTTPWILQLGGHHLGINIYYKGATGVPTPYHVAAQPTVWKDDRGKTHDVLAPMRENLHGLLDLPDPRAGQAGEARRAVQRRLRRPPEGRQVPRQERRGPGRPSFPTRPRISSRRRSRPGPATAPRAPSSARSTRPSSTRSRWPTRARRTSPIGATT